MLCEFCVERLRLLNHTINQSHFGAVKANKVFKKRIGKF